MQNCIGEDSSSQCISISLMHWVHNSNTDSLNGTQTPCIPCPCFPFSYPPASNWLCVGWGWNQIKACRMQQCISKSIQIIHIIVRKLFKRFHNVISNTFPACQCIYIYKYNIISIYIRFVCTCTVSLPSSPSDPVTSKSNEHQVCQSLRKKSHTPTRGNISSWAHAVVLFCVHLYANIYICTIFILPQNIYIFLQP